MKNMTLENIAKATGGALFHAEGMEQKEAAGVVLDSRKVEAGYVFLAAKGERVDGHSFIEEVFEKGALAVICEKAPANPKGPYILVQDSFDALKKTAAFYRSQLSLKVVGITGSVGKTSTKEVIASTLAVRFRVSKTQGNYNNEIGLPLTILRLKEDTQIAVLEMGISDFGEMHRLSEIARPDVCVITNIGQCHLENLGSRDGILKAKTEIFDFMQQGGSVCLNGDDDKLAGITQVEKADSLLFFGKGEQCAIYASDCRNKGLLGSQMQIHREGRSFPVTIPLPGEHMIYNALAAAAVACVFGLTDEEISQGIAAVEPIGGRSHIMRTDAYTIIDDCYNANPVSMKAAIDLLTMSDTGKVAILGDMFELGEKEKELHEEVGAYAAYKNIDKIICVGNLCRSMYEGSKAVADTQSRSYYFSTKEDCMEHLPELLNPQDTVLVKASHGMHFEDIVVLLQKLGETIE